MQPNFSKHLFWDMPANLAIDQIPLSLLAERVMKYGRLEDWYQLKDYAGKNRIKQAVTQIKSLDEKSISFLCIALSMQKNDFQCYRNKQSAGSFWI